MDEPNPSETQNTTSLSRSRGGFKPAPTRLNIFSLVRNIFASAQNIIGIDIGSHSIKLLQLQKSAKGYAITNHITRTITQAVKDKPQEKKRIVKEFVKEFIAEARIKTTLGRVAVWGKGVFIFSLNVPLLNKKDLRGAVSMELKKRLPFQLSLENISFDFFVTGQTRDEKGLETLQITCVACDRLLLEEQVELLKEMGIRPIAINTIADALGNILPFCLEIPATKTAALLDSGANSSTLNFYRAATWSSPGDPYRRRTFYPRDDPLSLHIHRADNYQRRRRGKNQAPVRNTFRRRSQNRISYRLRHPFRRTDFHYAQAHPGEAGHGNKPHLHLLCLLRLKPTRRKNCILPEEIPG